MARSIRMMPGHAIRDLAEKGLDRDTLGRETFGFFLECGHGWEGVLLCTESRTVREVADMVATMAIDNCVQCFALSAQGVKP